MSTKGNMKAFSSQKWVAYSNMFTYTTRLTMNQGEVPDPFSFILKKFKIEPNHY